MATGSNPVFGATKILSSETPINRDFKEVLSFQTPKPQNVDTTQKIYDTKYLRIYKVNHIYYYRKRIKQKLFRISLKTKDIKEALRRKRVLDLISEEELFKLETKDFKLLFEYDTETELRAALEQVKEMQINSALKRFNEVKNHLEDIEDKPTYYMNFEQLRDRYLTKLKRDGNSDPTAYDPTFKKLIEFFKERDIAELKESDMEAFKDFLAQSVVRSKPLSKKTINKHLGYVKKALKYIDITIADKVALYGRRQVQKEEPKKENYTLSEVRKILKFDYQVKELSLVYKIALYTGMRQGEIRELSQEDIKFDNDIGIHYFDITEAKSECGVRKVPIHKDILDLVLNSKFPLIPDSLGNKNKFSKLARYHLYKAIEDRRERNFHTLRANFIDKIVECNKHSTNQFILDIIQEVVRHSADDKKRLTLTTYKKGFSLQDKMEAVNLLSY